MMRDKETQQVFNLRKKRNMIHYDVIMYIRYKHNIQQVFLSQLIIE